MLALQIAGGIILGVISLYIIYFLAMIVEFIIIPEIKKRLGNYE